MEYLNFDLLIERAPEGGYAARVTQSPAGEATGRFELPFSELELENYLLKIGRPRRGVRRLHSPEMAAAQTFGHRLFEAVFGSEVFGCFRSSLDRAEEKETGLRLRLRLRAPELADLPWEYLYNPALNRFLVLAVETPLVRYLELPERIRPLAVSPPLKILTMISSPHDYATLDVEQEWHKLNEALTPLQKRGVVALERLPEATLSALQRCLRQSQYHIFHFIGHGAFDEPSHDGVLLLEDEMQRGRRVSGQYLGTLLHNHRPLRLAVLNACEGGRTSRNEPFSGTAQSLVQQGLPAVIAMQFEITDAAAITFAHEFYAALADGYPVDAAVVEARTAIFAADNDVEWATPVLYMRAPDGKIFDMALAKASQPPTPPRETSKPKAAPATQPAQNAVHTPTPPAPKPKPATPSAPISPKTKTLWRNPWILLLATITLVLTGLAVFRNLDFQEPQSKVPPTQMAEQPKTNESERLYFQYRSEGDTFFNQGKYESAKLRYLDALKQKPGEDYAANRVNECNQKIAEQENATKREKNYEQHRDAGDAYFRQSDYTKAKNEYEQARSFKNNDRYVSDRIQECSSKLLVVRRPKVEVPPGMVPIPAGYFMMGSEDGDSNEKPVHKVYVDAFYMDKYEVTVAQYQRFLDANAQQQRPDKWQEQLQNPNHPVVYVSWDDASAYVRWANKKLPTEAQWEYACRAGTTTPFSTGDNLTTEQANYDGNYPYKNYPKGKYLGKTAPVGSYPPNAWGLYDMHGNVWEWCQDWYDDQYYGRFRNQAVVKNPPGPETGSSRVVRGGSWSGGARHCRSADRLGDDPDNRSSSIGFRLVFVP